MASVYTREFKDRMYRHYINQIFSDIEDDSIIFDERQSSIDIRKELTSTIESLIEQDFHILCRQYFERDFGKDGYALEVDLIINKVIVALTNDVKVHTDALVDKLLLVDDETN